MRIAIFLTVLVMLTALFAAGCSDEKKPSEEYTTKSATEYYPDKTNGTDVTQENASEPMKHEVTPVIPGKPGEQNKSMGEGNMTQGGMMHEGNMTHGGMMHEGNGTQSGGMMHEGNGTQGGGMMNQHGGGNETGGQNSSDTTTI